MFAVKLPGRESRAKEPFFQNMQQIVDEVIGALLPLLKEKPFALFGHRYDNNTSLKVNLYYFFSTFSVLFPDLFQFWSLHELRCGRCSEEAAQPRTSSHLPVRSLCTLCELTYHSSAGSFTRAAQLMETISKSSHVPSAVSKTQKVNCVTKLHFNELLQCRRDALAC